MHEIGYLIGKYWKKAPIAYIFIFLIFTSIVYSAFKWSTATKSQPVKQIQTQPAKQSCINDEKMHAQYQQHIDKKEYWKASRSIAYCVVETKDPELTEKQTSAEALSYEEDASNKSISAQTRLDSIKKLSAINKEKAAKFSQLIPKLEAEVKKIEAEQKRRELARRKKEGVTLGMTPEEVTQSMWGKPERVNRTINAYGVREQWVYGNGGYLYFRNGILESIQN